MRESPLMDKSNANRLMTLLSYPVFGFHGDGDILHYLQKRLFIYD